MAYTNNVAGATQTTLFAYDFASGSLGTIGGLNSVPSPNTGVFNVVGASGRPSRSTAAGFDISGVTGTAYLSFNAFSPAIDFFTINLATGLATQIGNFGAVNLVDFSVQTAPVNRVPISGTLSLVALGLVLAGRTNRRRGVPAAR